MPSGTLSAAAKRVNISESALSRQLSLLEAELSMKLFSRDNLRLAATEEGELFLLEAEQILEFIEQIPEIVSAIKGRHARAALLSLRRAGARSHDYGCDDGTFRRTCRQDVADRTAGIHRVRLALSRRHQAKPGDKTTGENLQGKGQIFRR